LKYLRFFSLKTSYRFHFSFIESAGNLATYQEL